MNLQTTTNMKRYQHRKCITQLRCYCLHFSNRCCEFTHTARLFSHLKTAVFAIERGV